MNSSRVTRSEVISGIETLIERYDGFLIDQWGVLHNGVKPFPGVVATLQALQESAKKVVILSNSGRRAAVNQQRMEQMGIAPTLYQAVLTSGEAAWVGFNEKRDATFSDLGKRCLYFSRNSDRSSVDGLALDCVDHAEQADFVFLSGLDSEDSAIVAVREQLTIALSRKLPLLCSNPDLTGLDGDRLILAPGTIAEEYAEQGGEVRYIGKPWPTIYRIALDYLQLSPEKIVAIGDSLQHDIQGAAGIGVDGAFITNGIHRDAFANVSDSVAILEALTKLLSAESAAPRWVMSRFCLS